MKPEEETKGIITIILALIVVLLTSEAFAQGTWETKAPMPTARDALAAGVVNNKIYAIGGRAGDSSWITTVEEYDPAANQWTTKASMPTNRSYLAVGVVNNKIYAIGGYTSGSSYLATVEEYDPATDTWTNCGTPAPGNGCTPMPTARNFLAAGVVNNKIYAIGGQGAGPLTTVEEYDPATNQWATKAPMPTARMHLAVGVANDKVYAIGGNPGSSPYTLTTVEEYNPASNTWTNCGGTCASMPTALLALAVGVVNNKIYAIGGYDVVSYFDTVEEYDPVTNQWTTKAPMPTARAWLAVDVVNNKIYAIGGGNDSGWLNTVEEGTFAPPPVITVAIDIKPGSFPNSINPRGKGNIPVAILTTDSFDATTVDEATALFGPTGTEAPPVHVALEDVDLDGDIDMILHFTIQSTGIMCGDTSASLTGETFGGQAIEGSDSITTAGCK